MKTMAGNPGDGRLARCFLAIPQHLTQEGPKDNSGRVDAVLAKEAVVAAKDLGDLFLRDDGTTVENGKPS